MKRSSRKIGRRWREFYKKSLRLYAVTDRSWLHGETLYEQVEKGIKRRRDFGAAAGKGTFGSGF